MNNPWTCARLIASNNGAGSTVPMNFILRFASENRPLNTWKHGGGLNYNVIVTANNAWTRARIGAPESWDTGPTVPTTQNSILRFAGASKKLLKTARWIHGRTEEDWVILWLLQQILPGLARGWVLLNLKAGSRADVLTTQNPRPPHPMGTPPPSPCPLSPSRPLWGTHPQPCRAPPSPSAAID